MARYKKNKRSSMLNLPKQRQVCPSLFFQFNMHISVIYVTLRVSCKRVVSVLSPLASNSCGGSHFYMCMDMTCLIVNSRQRCGWDKMPKNIISKAFRHFSNNGIQQWRPEYCVRMYCWSRWYSDEASCPGEDTEKMYWIHKRYGNVSAIGSLQDETDGNSFL